MRGDKATAGWMAQGSNSSRGEIFFSSPNGPARL